MRKSMILASLIVASALGAPLVLSGPGVAASATSARSATSAPAQMARQMHRFRGTVTSTSRSHRWFRMRTTTHRSLRIHTTSSTRWDDCDWGSMGYGHHVDVRAHRSHGMWVASSMHNWHDSGDWGGMWMH